MAIDVSALVRALAQDPAQRSALREALGIADVDLLGALKRLADAQGRTEDRLDRLGQRVEELAHAQTRTEARVEELAQAQARTEARVEELAQAQARTEARLDELSKRVAQLAAQMSELAATVAGLLDVSAGLVDRMGEFAGHDLERRYRERGPAYLLRLARRLELIDSQALAVMVDDAQLDERITQLEAESLMVADAVFRGRLRDTGEPVHVVLEVSMTVARHDVRRARERADLLARLVETPVLAAVAGDHVPEPVAVAAQDAEVWCVRRGRVLAPTDDVDDFLG